MVNSLFSPRKKYDLAAFSASFQTRLRELALPKEVYHLQLADIDGTIDLGPNVNFYGPVYDIQYNAKEGKTFVRKTKSSVLEAVADNTLYSVKNWIELHQVTSSLVGPAFFHQCYTVPNNVYIVNSTIDIALLIALSKSFKPTVKGIPYLYNDALSKNTYSNYDPTVFQVFCYNCQQVYSKDKDSRSMLSLLNPFNTDKCSHKKLTCEKPTFSKKTKTMETAKKLFQKFSKFTDPKGKGF